MTNEQYYYGTGRRKSSVARVRLYPGSGQHMVNDRPLEETLPGIRHRFKALRPLAAADVADKFHVQARVAGGGLSGWADAIAHGVARALVAADESVRKPLRRQGMLTRDSRVKERKKYGLKRARKAPQYTKR